MSSMNNLSVDGEFRYIVTWFTEWSVLQREDFVPVLVSWLLRDPEEKNTFVAVEINEKPMSLFQCRIKLFNEWSPKWPLEFKYKLKEKIIEIDSKVGEKIIHEINGLSNGNSNNELEKENEVSAAAENGVGAVNAAAEQIIRDNEAVVVAVESTEVAAINADNTFAAVLNNETPVDDFDDDKDAQTTVVPTDSGNETQQNAEEPAEPVEIQQTHDKPVVTASAAGTVTVANSASEAEVPSVA